MRITNIHTYTCWLDWCNLLFVRVSTDEGLHGWGEASLHGPVESVETAIHEMAEGLIGKDPGGVEAHWQSLYHGWRWRGGATLNTALAGLDIALWDLEGKRLGVPVHRLLGGAQRGLLRVYASHWLTQAQTAGDVAAGAREAVDRGFRGFKWSPFKRDVLQGDEARAIREATEKMAAAREAVGPDVEIYIECSEFLSPRTAVAAGRAFAPYRPAWFEEPIPFENARAMAQLQRDLDVPIATGERLLSRWEFRELLETSGCRVIQPDLMHAAGLSECKRIATMADTYYVPVAPHNPGGPICNLAAMHLAAAIPNFLVLEQMEDQRTARDRMCTDPVTLEDGHFLVPQTPGLGTDLIVEEIERLAFQPQPRRDVRGSLWR